MQHEIHGLDSVQGELTVLGEERKRERENKKEEKKRKKKQKIRRRSKITNGVLRGEEGVEDEFVFSLFLLFFFLLCHW